MNGHRLNFGLILILFVITGCSHGQCNNVPQRPNDEQLNQNIKETNDTASAPISQSKDSNFVIVYKDSGQKQCDKNAGIKIEKLKALLEKNKINVLESHTQNDGKIHMQVCGSPAGMLHTFTIETKYLKKARKLGFQVLSGNK
jgi:hypothetical protein